MNVNQGESFGQFRAAGLLQAVREWLPRGSTLPAEDWLPRQRAVVALLWAHAVGLGAYGLYVGLPFTHVLLESSIIVAFAIASSLDALPRRVRSCVSSVGLMSCSGILVHFSGGYIEAHFHFFVMLGVISLYEDWAPFLLSIGYVALHHGILGTLAPTSVYNHADALANPWEWALIHAAFVLGLSVVNVFVWRISEKSRERTSLLLDERARAAEDLRRSRADLQDFVETSAIGLHWVGPDGTILWANEADHVSLGYSSEEYVGRKIHEFHADPHVIEDILTRLKRGERLHEYPARLLAKDGTIRHVLIDSSVLWDGDEFVHTRCFTRDVTSNRKAEEDLAAARVSLAQAQKLAAIGTLVSGLFHEVRTPLTYIQTNAFVLHRAAERAREEGKPGLPVQVVVRHADDIVQGTERINRLVEDLRRFTRLEPALKQPSSLDHVVSEAVDLFRVTHRDVPVVLSAEATPTAMIDRAQVQQIVLNLLQNAAEASASGIPIEITCEAVDSSIARLTVSDRGAGILDEVAARMFEPLYTTKENGTGLGLAIVQRICQDHGATISWETARGKGTTFRIDFPAIAPIPAPARRLAPAASVRAHGVDHDARA